MCASISDAPRRAKATDGLCALRLRLFLAPHLPRPVVECLTILCLPPAPTGKNRLPDVPPFSVSPWQFKRHQAEGTGFGNCVYASFTTGIRWPARSRTPSFRRKSFDVHVQFAACILLCMASRGRFRESRRSTRIPLKLTIAVEEDGTECLTCDGETIFVNLHGALISTAIALRCGTRISIHVYLTDKVAGARVVYVDPGSLLHCGIELDCPRNIWGVPLPPDDWRMDVETGRH